MVGCSDIQARFSELYDGELADAERLAVEEHFAACSTCREEYEVFRNSITALQTTGSVETGEQFETTVRLALAAEVERDELFRQTGLAQKPPEIRIVYRAPRWLPLAAAAGLIAAFLVGFLARPGREPVPTRGLEEKIAALQKERDDLKKLLAAAPVVPVVQPEEKLREWGFAKLGGVWLPAEARDRLAKGEVFLKDGFRSEQVAFETLAKDLGWTPTTSPGPTHPVVAGADRERWLREWGFEKLGDTWLPMEWVERIEGGLVMTGPGEFRSVEEFERAFLARHDLVEFEGRYLSREERDRTIAQRVVRKSDVATVENAVTRSLEGLEIGVPVSHKNLTLYPILSLSPVQEVSFRTLHEVLADGRVEVLDDGNPFRLRVKNNSDDEVLVLAGELFSGGRTTRVAAEDMVVPKRKTVSVPVFCVEPGGWRTGDRMMDESGHYIASPQVRLALIAGAGQGVLWSEVARHAGSGGEMDAYRARADQLAQYRLRFAELAQSDERIVGLAMAINNGVEYVEIFGNHGIFTAYFERVLAAATLEAVERLDEKTSPTRLPNSVGGVKRLVEGAFFASYDMGDAGCRIAANGRAVGLSFLPGGAPLRTLLYGEENPSWSAAAYAVPEEKVARVIAEYEKLYKAGGALARAAIVRDLSTISSPRTAAMLQKCLGEPDLAVRREVIDALAIRGDGKDEKLVNDLLFVLNQSRKEPTVFKSAARTLAKLGNKAAVKEFLSVLDSGDRTQVEIVMEAMPELLLQVTDRKVLEPAVQRLISFHENAQAAVNNQPTPNPLQKLKIEDYQALSGRIEKALQSVTDKGFDSPAKYRAWWNDRQAREAFLNERTRTNP